MIVLLVMMASISASLRILPFLFSKWVGKWPLLEKIGVTLPSAISILLVAHLLEPVAFNAYPFGMPEIAGLASVALIQTAFRNILLSMGAGVLTHQLLTHFL